MADTIPEAADVSTGAAQSALEPGSNSLQSAHHVTRRWVPIIIPIGLFLLVFVVFMPALDAGLVNWDDDRLLFSHTRHHSLTPENLAWMFSTSDFGHFQPMTWLSFAMDYALWGEDPFGYHVTSVAIHAATVIVFYFIAVRLLAACPKRGLSMDSEGRLHGSAAVAAVFFGCHPLRAESVAWLAERRDVLSGLFCLLSVLFYLKKASGESSPRTAVVERENHRSRIFLVLSVFFFVLSLLAKASAMTLAFVFILLDIYPLRRLNVLKPASMPMKPGSVLAEKLPFLFFGILAAGRALFAQHQAGALRGLSENDVWTRMSNAPFGLLFYLWKTALPTGLGPLVQLPHQAEDITLRLAVSVGILVVGAWLLVRFRNRCPGGIIAVLCYVVLVMPVLGLVQSGPQLVADRYSYLSCLGFAVLVGWLVLKVRQSLEARLKEGAAAITTLGAVTLCAVLSHTTFAQASYWRDPLSLWARGVSVSPNSSIAHVNYADALAQSVQYQLARRHYDRALELDSQDAIAWHHRGDLYFLLERADEAIADYLSALSMDPTRRAHFPLAKLLVHKGRMIEAIAVLRDGLRRYPASWPMMDYLASLLSTYPDGRYRDGREAVEWAEKLNQHYEEKHAPTLLTLATALAEMGRFAEAVKTGHAGLRISQVQDDHRLAAEFERRLSLFSEGRTYSFGADMSGESVKDHAKSQPASDD
ncbi:MAG: tetratricopeptide repeat protein [Planctomycetota bacterium]